MNSEDLFNIPFALLLMGAAEKTGILGTLRQEARTAEQLATALDLDRRAVWTVLEALVEQGERQVILAS